MIPFVSIGLLCWLPGSLCSCPLIPPDTARARADVVFAGTVLAIDSLPSTQTTDGRSSFPTIVANFAVFTVWKGEVQGTVEVTTLAWSAACGVPFKSGMSYIVYAQSSSFTSRLRTEQCMMTRELIRAIGDIARFGPGRRP